MRPSQARPLTPSQQIWHLQRNPVYSGSGRLFPNKLVWKYSRRPFVLARRYEKRIEYAVGAIGSEPPIRIPVKPTIRFVRFAESRKESQFCLEV